MFRKIEFFDYWTIKILSDHQSQKVKVTDYNRSSVALLVNTVFSKIYFRYNLLQSTSCQTQIDLFAE